MLAHHVLREDAQVSAYTRYREKVVRSAVSTCAGGARSTARARDGRGMWQRTAVVAVLLQRNVEGDAGRAWQLHEALQLCGERGGERAVGAAR